MDKKDGGTIDLESLRGHTPGPWDWVIHDQSMATLGVLPDPGLGDPMVMNVSPCGACAGRVTEWQWGNCGTPKIEDACLIAIAPTLLAEYERLTAELTARRARDADVEALVAAAKRTTDAFRALGESTPFTRHADRCHHECEQAMVALDAAILPLQRSDKGGETCPLPAHWRMAIEERGIENPKALDWIEQRARQMAKVAKC